MFICCVFTTSNFSTHDLYGNVHIFIQRHKIRYGMKQDTFVNLLYLIICMHYAKNDKYFYLTEIKCSYASVHIIECAW